MDRRALLLTGGGVATTAALVTVEPAEAGRSRTFTFDGSFTSPDTPDWHYLPFKVPPGVREIEVSYSYDRTDTGAGFSVNVVDIGIFDPSGRGIGRAEGFRGWSGGARDRFRISRGSATPGYLPGPITPGTWNVILGPFLIVPPGTSYVVTVTLHFGPQDRPFRAKPARRAVPGRGPGWFRGDLHTHTVHSDGAWTQAQLARAARAAGLDFIGSSEHNTSSASLTWGRYAPDDLLVLPGEEVTTRAGHWLAMGLPPGTWIDWRYRPGEGHLDTFTRRVASVGGLAVACHPFVPIRGTQWDFGYDYSDVDVIEVWNGPWTLDDQTAVQNWHALLVAGRFVPVMGNSDSHNEGQTVGRAQTVVRASSLSVGAIIRGLKKGRAWIAESSAVELDLTAGPVSIGDTAPAGSEVTLRVSGVPGCLAQLIGPAGPIAGAPTTGPRGEATLSATPPPGTAFVRAEVRRLDGAPVLNPLEGVPALAMVAMTNPVFLA